MKFRTLFSLALATVGAAIILSTSAKSQIGPGRDYVILQGATPGFSQSGNFNVSGNARAGQFIGSGSGLTNLSASALVSGSIADSLLSTNIARRDLPNTFNVGPNMFTGFLGVGRSVQVTSAESFGIGNNSTSFDGMYVRTAAPGLPFYGYSLGGAVSAYHYVDGYDQNKWKLFQGSTIGLTVDTSGNVGMGTMDPSSKLHVTTTGGLIAGGFYNPGSSNGATAVLGASTSTTGAVTGGKFTTASSSGRAVYGESLATSGFDSSGGLFVANAPGSSGVLGISATGNGVEARGVTGFFNRNTYANGWGIYVEGLGSNTLGGYFTSSDSNAIVARSFGTQPTIRSTTGINLSTAIEGECTSPFSTGAAVRGINASGTGVAVQANGRLVATGTKSFRIDHPLDPENQYLYHYCAEGPEPKNVYDGTVVTNAKGWATVTLPSYFESINKDPRIQLTVEDDSDQFIMVKSVGGVKNGQFQIRTNMPNIKVYWEVKAVRNDLWIQRKGAPIEVDKPEESRGKYQHPELYDQPETRGEYYRKPSPTRPSHSSVR